MRTRVLHIIILLYGLLVLAACSGSEPRYKVGVSQCSSGHWRDKVNQEMLAAQHLYEHDVEVTIANSYDDAKLQARQIDSLGNEGIDLLVVAPNEDSPDINAAISRIHSKGIPVVFFDRKTSFADYTAFIGGNNVEAGRLVGRYAVTLVGQHSRPAKPIVMEITGHVASTPARERHEGFKSVMDKHEHVEYICCQGDWTSEEAYRMTIAQIKTGRLPDIVFCHNDGMATGVYKAAVETGTEKLIRIIGIDGMPGEGLEYVQLGHQVGTYVYPTHGEEIVRLAIDILSGNSYERDNELRGQMVTPQDVEQTALNAEELMKQNDNLITIQNKLESSLIQYNTQKKLLMGSLLTIVMLLIAVMIAVRAYVLTKKAIRQRQSLNEQQTLLYTDTNRRHMVEIFSPQEELPKPKTQDMLFAEQLSNAIRKNLSNPNLKMDDLGESVGLSRVQLYRRVKAVTGLTPVELLRQMRLQQAYVLLAGTTKTVAEIAFEVGFNTPGYFSKCFKEQYGKLPMELRESTDSTNQTL